MVACVYVVFSVVFTCASKSRRKVKVMSFEVKEQR